MTADEIKDWCVYNLEPEMFCTYIGPKACRHAAQMIAADRNEYLQEEPLIDKEKIRRLLYE